MDSNSDNPQADVSFINVLKDLTTSFFKVMEGSKKKEELYSKFGRSLLEVIFKSDIADAFVKELVERSQQYLIENSKESSGFICLPFMGPMSTQVSFLRLNQNDTDDITHRLAASLLAASKVNWLMRSNPTDNPLLETLCGYSESLQENSHCRNGSPFCDTN